MKKRFKEQQTKQRHKRREWQKQWKEEELAKLKPDERQRKIDKEMQRKETRLMREDEMFRSVMELNNLSYLPPEDEIALRRHIRQDVRVQLKLEYQNNVNYDTSDEEYYNEDDNMDRRIEEKVQFGSDSDQDIVEYVMRKHTSYLK